MSAPAIEDDALPVELGDLALGGGQRGRRLGLGLETAFSACAVILG